MPPEPSELTQSDQSDFAVKCSYATCATEHNRSSRFFTPFSPRSMATCPVLTIEGSTGTDTESTCGVTVEEFTKLHAENPKRMNVSIRIYTTGEG